MSAPPLPPSVEHDCRAERQERSEWCWAGCLRGLAKFAGVGCPEQAALAGILSGVPGADVPSGPPESINRLCALLGIACVGPTGPLWALGEELAAGHPVLVGYLWAAGGGHFAIVRGYTAVLGARKYLVSDPLAGEGVVTGEELVSAYGRGRWAYTWGRFAKKQ